MLQKECAAGAYERAGNIFSVRKGWSRLGDGMSGNGLTEIEGPLLAPHEAIHPLRGLEVGQAIVVLVSLHLGSKVWVSQDL